VVYDGQDGSSGDIRGRKTRIASAAGNPPVPEGGGARTAEEAIYALLP
jgi:hypothetical protein